MNIYFLQFAALLMWLAVLVGAYQRYFDMPKWFANPPASFEFLRRQSRSITLFWIPLSAISVLVFASALFLNRSLPVVVNYILASTACFALAKTLSAVYFVKEIVAFSKTPITAPKTPGLMIRVKFWRRWTVLRDVLQVLAALLITMARAIASA